MFAVGGGGSATSIRKLSQVRRSAKGMHSNYTVSCEDPLSIVGVLSNPPAATPILEGQCIFAHVDQLKTAVSRNVSNHFPLGVKPSPIPLPPQAFQAFPREDGFFNRG